MSTRALEPFRQAPPRIQNGGVGPASRTEGRAGIQKRGVDRMSEMSSMLRIHLDRDAVSPNEPK